MILTHWDSPTVSLETYPPPTTPPPTLLRQNVFFCCRNHDTVQRFGGEMTGKGGSELVFPQVANLQTVGGQLAMLSNFRLAYSENHFQ